MKRVPWFLVSLAVPALASMVQADDSLVVRVSTDAQKIEKSSQDLADELASHFKTSGRLKKYDIAIDVEGGVVTLSGQVSDEIQRVTALTLARRYPGVVAVEDRLSSRSIVQARYQPTAVAPKAPASLPKPVAESASQPGPVIEPAPIADFSGGVAPYSDTPTLPPYAWPSYTPYNNYASMAYQTQYPSGAWPFIGPPHPYPMIPSGWRRVTLKWQRGYWFMNFRAF